MTPSIGMSTVHRESRRDSERRDRAHDGISSLAGLANPRKFYLARQRASTLPRGRSSLSCVKTRIDRQGEGESAARSAEDRRGAFVTFAKRGKETDERTQIDGSIGKLD